MRTIHQIEKRDRPREKLLAKGPHALSDAELIAILLGKGSAGHDVLTIARQVVRKVSKTEELTLDSLLEIKGLGQAKALQLLACYALMQRKESPRGQRLQGPKDILSLVGHLSHKKQEHLLSFTLDGAGCLIKQRTVFVGLLNRVEIHPREIFADAITDRAAGIILAHNHPSKNITPSNADKETTKELREAAEILGIDLIDHIIFHGQEYFSFRQHQLLQKIEE